MDKFPGIDMSFALNATSAIQKHFDEIAKVNYDAAEEAYNNRQRLITAAEKTAENTAENNTLMEAVIRNQNDYISLLKKQVSNSEEQLRVLERIFSAGADSAVIEKEILSLVEAQMGESHPLWEFMKDKGGDVLIPMFINAVKAYLISNGIPLP